MSGKVKYWNVLTCELWNFLTVFELLFMKIIEIKDLGKAYSQAHEQILVLEEISLEIKKGEFVSIVGPSGSGKSTLLNIIGLLDDVYSGSVSVSGQDFSRIGEKGKALFRLKNVGFIFQFDSLLPEFDVLENLDMPARILGRGNARVCLELLKKFDLSGLARKAPSEISGGEKQRIAVLRALRNNPQILIADEPTGNLDKHNARLVFEDLKKISRSGVTVVMVTHNEEAALTYSDSVYHLESSKIRIVKSK